MTKIRLSERLFLYLPCVQALNYSIYPIGDNALTIEFGNTICEQTNDAVMQLFHQLKKKQVAFIIDIIPAYSSISVIYNTVAIKKSNPNLLAFDSMQQQILKEMEWSHVNELNRRQITIPVCYDITLGPDLNEVADYAKLSMEEVIALHTATHYKVYMIGFLPGFPYMATVDEKIQLPRKAQPRTLVAPGSVGIAGAQTGIYPLASPGGWQLIGQTPLKIFDVTLEMPCLLQPGDEVRFESISLEAFHQFNNKPHQ